MEENICSLVRWHLKVFRISAFLPISLSTNPKNIRIEEILWTVWGLVFMMLYNTISAWFLIYHAKNPAYKNDVFGFSIDCIKISITTLSMQIYILEPLFKRNKHKAFWKLYSQLNPSRRLAPLPKQLQEYKGFILKFYGYLTINIIVESLVSWDVGLSFLSFLSLFFPFMYLLKMRTMHLIFSVELVKVEIQNLDKDLKLLVEYTEFGQRRATFSNFDEFIRARVLQKQKMYQGIFEMIETFKDACGISIIANYVRSYSRLLVSLYWLYWRFYRSELIIQDVLLIPAILEIPMFLLTAKNCMNAAKYISYRVHNLKRSDNNVATSIQIQNFSLQLMHQKIKIDGLGIAAMDGYMLTKFALDLACWSSILSSYPIGTGTINHNQK